MYATIKTLGFAHPLFEKSGTKTLILKTSHFSTNCKSFKIGNAHGEIPRENRGGEVL